MIPELEGLKTQSKEILEELAKKIVCNKCVDTIDTAEGYAKCFETKQIEPEWLYFQNSLISRLKEYEAPGGNICMIIGDKDDQVWACKYVAAQEADLGSVYYITHADLSDRLGMLGSSEKDLTEFADRLCKIACLVISDFGQGRLGETGTPVAVSVLRRVLDYRSRDAGCQTYIGCSMRFRELSERANEEGRRLLEHIRNATIIKDA